jgi:hypothetical protein
VLPDRHPRHTKAEEHEARRLGNGGRGRHSIDDRLVRHDGGNTGERVEAVVPVLIHDVCLVEARHEAQEEGRLVGGEREGDALVDWVTCPDRSFLVDEANWGLSGILVNCLDAGRRAGEQADGGRNPESFEVKAMMAPLSSPT